MPKETFSRLHPEKKERVMRSAIREFNKNGFERAKVGDIAAGAGVAKGSIYQYFDDKREIYIHCARWGLDQFMKQLDLLMDFSEMDVFDYFKDSAPKMEVAKEERELTLFMQNMQKEPELLGDSMKEMLRVSDDYVSHYIRTGQRKKTVRADIGEDLLALYYLSVTVAFKKRFLELYIDLGKDNSEACREAVEREIGQMLELLRNGMGYRND